MVFDDKNLDLFYDEIKSFGLKNIKFAFKNLEKNGLWFIKDQICFLRTKKMVFW